jgi:hypothetical protein
LEPGAHSGATTAGTDAADKRDLAPCAARSQIVFSVALVKPPVGAAGKNSG